MRRPVLSDDDLLRLYMQQNIPLIGRKVVEQIRGSEPVRRVGGGFLNVATRFASLKMDCVIQAESHKVELPVLYRWEHDPNTHEFYDQPSRVKLSYVNAGGKHVNALSTPDYFVIQENWMGWVECKREEELQQSHKDGSERFAPDGNGGWRCPPGEAFAAEYGLGFRVISSKETNWILVRNLVFLSDYLRTDCPSPTEEAIEVVKQHFSDERWILLQRLLEGDGVCADTVFTMIARESLFVDMEHELLSEPGFTNVCRDALSSEIYRNQKLSSCTAGAIQLKTIRVAPGTPILWDGSPWRILNVGDKDIFLEDENHAISNLQHDTFRILEQNGAITGLPEEVDQRYALAADVLKRAAPVDLESAVARAGHLASTERTATSPPERTLRYWRKQANEGEIAYGNQFVGLVPKISRRGNRMRKIDATVVAAMDEIIDQEVLTSTKSQISICYGMVRNLCAERGLLSPSEKTFRAEITRRREEAIVLAREGRKAAYSCTEFQWLLDQSTPRHGERPFEIGHIDHTELDLELVDSRKGANLGRPWLTLLVDAYTRVVLAFFITFDPPSYRSCMAVIREAVRRHGRIPQTIVVDKGSEFNGMYFECLMSRLTSHKKSRPTAKSRFGSVIERLFGINNKAFIHNLIGNSQALQRPRSMSRSHDPRDLAVWTLPALTGAFQEFVDDVYANLSHPALGISPKEAMSRGLAMSGIRGHLLISFTEDFLILCMPTTPAGKAVVRPGRGIKIKGIHYWSPKFRDAKVERTKVPLRYDPFDVSRAYALVDGKWVLCRSEYQSLFERRTEREIHLITQEIRALYGLAESKRGDRASAIAAFIGKARTTEAVLLQQRRDAEQVSNGSPPALPCPSTTPNEQKPDSESFWSVPITIENFEELK